MLSFSIEFPSFERNSVSHDNFSQKSPICLGLKFVFSKKATKIDEIFTVNLTLTVKSTVKISSIFLAFLDNMNFKRRSLESVWEKQINILQLQNCSPLP